MLSLAIVRVKHEARKPRHRATKNFSTRTGCNSFTYLSTAYWSLQHTNATSRLVTRCDHNDCLLVVCVLKSLR
jgi:hypothetical protein